MVRALLSWLVARLRGWKKRPPLAGVREPRRPRPTLPAAAVALAEPRTALWHRMSLHRIRMSRRR